MTGEFNEHQSISRILMVSPSRPWYGRTVSDLHRRGVATDARPGAAPDPGALDELLAKRGGRDAGGPLG